MNREFDDASSHSMSLETWSHPLYPDAESEIIDNVTAGKSNLIIFSDLPTINPKITSMIRTLRAQDKPLVLAVEAKLAAGEQQKLKALSHLEGISELLITESDLYENSLIRFRSNVHRVSERKHNPLLRFRLSKPVSPYTEKAGEVIIEDENYLPLENLTGLVEKYQQKGKKIVVAAGVFDVLHAGHFEFFEKARELGDVLIVLTNSDYSAKLQPKNARDDRPINNLADRVEVLSSTDSVNHIAAFDTKSVLGILKKLRNITYVKTDKDISKSVRREIKAVEKRGGKTVILPAIRDPREDIILSTTNIIDTHRETARGIFPHAIPATDFKEIIRGVVNDYFDVEYAEIAPVFDDLVNGILVKLITLNSRTGIITTARNEYISSLSGTTEQKVSSHINAITKLFREVISEIPDNELKDLKTYVSLFFKTALNLAGMDPDMFPIQYADADTHFGSIFGAKLADGRMIFIDPSEKKIYDPVIFEEYYRKLLPQHTSYLLKGDKEMFARRIYFEPKNQRTAAMVMNVLYEKYGEDLAAQTEIKQLFAEVFRDFEIAGTTENKPPITAKEKTIFERDTKLKYPEIIAHGGLTALDLPVVWAENSKDSVAKALENKVDLLEIDVVPTKDGKWLASHFIDLGQISMASGTTLNYTLDELRKIHFKDRQGESLNSEFIGLDEVLDLAEKSGIPIKIDIKVKDYQVTNLDELVKIMKAANIPLEKYIVTCGDATITRMVHELEPALKIELNTVEATNFLLSNSLMKNPQMVDYFLDYIKKSAVRINAYDVSLMQVSVNTWGDAAFKKLVDGIHEIGAKVQVWVATNNKEYVKDAQMGVDSVLMHNPGLIENCMQMKNG